MKMWYVLYHSVETYLYLLNGHNISSVLFFRCLAKNSVLGKERRSSGVSVTVVDRGEGDRYKPPHFLYPSRPASPLSPKEPLRVIQGEDAIIECLATGVPLPTISWQRKCKFTTCFSIVFGFHKLK